MCIRDSGQCRPGKLGMLSQWRPHPSLGDFSRWVRHLTNRRRKLLWMAIAVLGAEPATGDSPEHRLDPERGGHHRGQHPRGPEAALGKERCFDVRASARFTTAKMMRKPALPMVEMLWRSKTFASTSVAPAVMRSPSSGWFQMGRSSCAGSSRALAIVYVMRAEP